MATRTPGPQQEPIKKKELEGGYDCEFVEQPPDILQTECSVCLQILREPTIVSCCGYSFCRTCIERVQASEKPCPLCNVSKFTTLHEKKLQRLLKERRVWCTMKDDGCEWAGELGKLDEHLNLAPLPEQRLKGCLHVVMKCSFCQELLQRQAVLKHESDQCPQRPYGCDYCRHYVASFDDVVNKHYQVCKCYPLSCPNRCDKLPDGFKCMIERQNLEHHVKEECVLTVVECDFHYAGCRVKLPRKDMAGHLVKSLVTHMSLLAFHSKRAIEELEKENRSLREGAQKALEERDEQIKLREDIQQKMSRMQGEITELEERVRLHSHLHTPPVTFKMTNFEQHKRNKDMWCSPPFFTHPHGYKLCIKVIQCRGNKCFISATLMGGEFDDCLQWPFQSDVYIRILNHLADENHITVTGDFSRDPSRGVRVAVVDEHQMIGQGGYIPYAVLKCQVDSTKNCQYLQDDCILLQVVRVVDTVQVQREIVDTVNHRSVRSPPCQFVMRDFEQHKRDNDYWYSPSFYTHNQGYRMGLRVVANGFDVARGTHVSVYIFPMCGEFDFHLRWPLRCNITIQLLNQLKDKEHHTVIISYTYETPDECACRVTVGERCDGLSMHHEFISHSKLGFNRARNCQYLENNCLIFKIAKIDFKNQ